MINLETPREVLVSWFQTEFKDLVKSMKNCSHHYDEDNLNAYHLEGDIFTHTMMVYKTAELLSNDNDLVKWSTLLHDIGKPRSMEIVEKHVEFDGLSDEGIYEKYQYLVDDFIEKEN